MALLSLFRSADNLLINLKNERLPVMKSWAMWISKQICNTVGTLRERHIRCGGINLALKVVFFFRHFSL